jgi:mono/diheme cytochrome c family protein
MARSPWGRGLLPSLMGRVADRGATGDGPREPRVFQWTLATLAAVYLGMRFGLPHLSVWLGLSEHPAPVPRFALLVYMVCALVGALVLVASDEERWQAFLAPPVRLLALAPGPGYVVRLLILATFPVLAGWIAWRQMVPGPPLPTTYRLQHPTIPTGFDERRNPLAALSAVEREEAAREGLVLYQKNCRPCHGAVGDGTGPLATGLRLRPIDFTDRGTLATLVEQYVLWRIAEGAGGLPPVSTPWHSAMPSWESELDESEMWRLVMAAYNLVGHEPRIVERRE